MKDYLTSQYETIGARMARTYNEHPDKDPYKPIIYEFIRRYREAPLFIVGTQQDPEAAENQQNHEYFTEAVRKFMPPYPRMLLDFASGLYKDKTGRPSFHSRCIIYLDTIGKDHYYINVLRTGEATKETLATMPEEKRNIINSIPMLKDPLDNPKGHAGEAGAYIIHIDRENARYAYHYSKEFTHDCAARCERTRGIIGYAPYSECKPESPCINKSSICRMYEETGPSTIQMVLDTIYYINRPDRYTVKVTPDMTPHEQRLREKDKKITFNKKPVHIVLDHVQVREIVAASHGGHHASPLPHQRRGHWRDLRAVRYKTQRSVWVRPADINKGLTVRVKKAVYEVLT